MPSALSAVMIEACRKALAGDGKLYRHPGGYWTAGRVCRHASRAECGSHTALGSYGTNTARAIVDRGAGRITRWQLSKRPGETRFAVEIAINPDCELLKGGGDERERGDGAGHD